MKPKITEKRKITLAGIDFYGDPLGEAGGWTMESPLGQLWKRFEEIFQKKQDAIKQTGEAGYEVWIDFDGEEDTKNHYIFIGVEVERPEGLPLELVTRTLPETRYAVYTLKGEAIRSDWSTSIFDWTAKAGYKQSYTYIFEYYDWERFKRIDDPNAELDIYVPVV